MRFRVFLLLLSVLGLAADWAEAQAVSIGQVAVEGSCSTGFTLRVEGCAVAKLCPCPKAPEYLDSSTVIQRVEYAIDGGGWTGVSFNEDRTCESCHSDCHDCQEAAEERGYLFSFSVDLRGLSPGQHTLVVRAGDSGGNRCPAGSGQDSTTFTVPECRTSCSSCQVLQDGQCLSCQEAGYPYCCGGTCSRDPCESGCRSDADCGGNVCCSGTCCGPGQVCCPGQGCVTGTSCGSPPPRGFNVVIAVWGSAWHRWKAVLRQPPYVRVPMSFRVWDPAAGQYVWETKSGTNDAPPTVPCRNRYGKRENVDVLVCGSRPPNLRRPFQGGAWGEEGAGGEGGGRNALDNDK